MVRVHGNQLITGRQATIFIGFILILTAWSMNCARGAIFPANVSAAGAQIGTDAVIAPKWLVEPTVDGDCQDVAYGQAPAGTAALLNPNHQAMLQVQLLHSGRDFYLCASGFLPTGEQRLVVRVDPHRLLGNTAMPGAYEFSVTSSGAITAKQAIITGEFVALALPTSDFTTTVAISPNQLWAAEMRITLDWLGGYARKDRLYLALAQTDSNTILAQWPVAANADLPSTWGELTLAPLYPDTVSAGSGFMDGQGGYFVIPYAAALNPTSITIEGWVRVNDGGCGTLVGNGQAISYWLGLCQVIQFGYGGLGSERSGQQAIDSGWHHIAVTMNSKGLRTYYLDGQVDVRPGWSPPGESESETEEQVTLLGASDRMLRIGSDRDATAGGFLHGYVRQLRVWNRVRTADEIRQTAFQELSGQEPGLVALWPFTTGLQDLAGGHDAGLIGNASLARDAPDVTELPQPPPFDPYTYPPPEAVPAWNATIPFFTQQTGDQDPCVPPAYDQMTHLTLEPERDHVMYMALLPDHLLLCTSLLLGQAGTDDAVTLWIDRSGQGGQTPGPTALRIHLTPDGKLAVGSGDGQGYSGPAPEGITGGAVSGPKVDFQEDLIPLQAPYWLGEIRIPLAALAPFTGGQTLRFAVRYQGSFPPNAQPGLPQGSITRSWPGSFEPAQPATWGTATTATPALSHLYLPLVRGDAATAAQTDPITDRSLPISLTTYSLGSVGLMSPDSGRAPPSYKTYKTACPYTDHPSLPLRLIGMAESMVSTSKKWPPVDKNENETFQRVEGTLAKIYVAAEDAWTLHTSNDVSMDLALENKDRWLTYDGSPELPLAELHLETESRGLPPNRDSGLQARPAYGDHKHGDHVIAIGQWVYDCDHYLTELHPIYILESDHIERRPSGFGDGLDNTVRIARVWMNSDPGGRFPRLLLTPFEFDLEIPSRTVDDRGLGGQIPFLRVTAGDASRVSWTLLANSKLRVRINPPGPIGQWYFEIMVGSLVLAKPSPLKTFTLWLDSIDIVEDRRLEGKYFTTSSAHWYLAVNVNGTWRQVFWDAEVTDTVVTPGYALHIPIPIIGGPLTFQVTAYSDHSPYSYPGMCSFLGGLLPVPALSYPCFINDELTSGVWQLGPAEELTGKELKLCATTSKFPPNLDPGCGGWVSSDWVLYYHISEGGTVPPVIDDPSFWEPRLVRATGADLGVLPVPDIGEPALSTRYTGYITEPPLQHGGTALLTRNVDRYRFYFDDFANISVRLSGDLPPPEVEKQWEWYAGPTVPTELKELLGYQGAQLKIQSATGTAGDQLYSISIVRTAAVLPPDWGVADDACTPGARCGRPVDLVTPDPAAIINNTLPLGGGVWQDRYLAKDWAWQHVRGEVHRYDVWIPGVKRRPFNQPECEFDSPGILYVSAPGMRLTDLATGTVNDGSYEIDNLLARLPDGGHIAVLVGSAARLRSFYQFDAHWSDAHYYDPQACVTLRRLFGFLKERFHTYPSDWFEISRLTRGGWRGAFPGIDGPTFRIPVYNLGAGGVINPDASGTLDRIISSPADQPVVARLYDADHVLLAEGMPVDDTGIGDSPIPGATFPQQRLSVSGLTPESLYALEVVPMFDTTGLEGTEMRIGVTEFVPAAR